jgi:hypothetical protein
VRGDDQGGSAPGRGWGGPRRRGSRGASRGGDGAAVKDGEHQGHAQRDRQDEEPASRPGRAGHVGDQVADPGQQAGQSQPEVSEVKQRSSALASPRGVPGAGDPPGHHRYTQADGDQPGGQRREAERGPAGRPGRRRRHGRAGRRDRVNQADQVGAVTRDQLALTDLPARRVGHGPQRPADGHIHLYLAQSLAGGRHRGRREVMTDRLHAELGARGHRTPRNRGRTGAAGRHPGQHRPGRHLRGVATPPGGDAAAAAPSENTRHVRAHRRRLLIAIVASWA